MDSREPDPAPAGFLAGLLPEEREAFEELAAERRYRPGQTLFHEGDESGGVFLIRSGHVKLSCAEGTREVVLSFAGPGDLLGELAAIDRGLRSATATAVGHVRALVLSARAFRRFLDVHPPAALRVIDVLAGRLRYSDRQRIEYAAYDVMGRLARRLLELTETSGEPAGAGVHITLPLTQDELAGLTGASREAVAKALHLLRELGWVATERRSLTVRDLEALRDFADHAAL